MKIPTLAITALFTAVGVTYIWYPFQQGFDVQDAPDPPPSVSLVSSSSAATAVDAIADSSIDVRPPYSVKTLKLI
jgi:hypothetical protein